MAVVLVGNELVLVEGLDSLGHPSGVLEQTTTQAIAALGGGGGYLHEQLVSSGTTNTTTLLGTNVLWNSATAGNKTNTIPQATGSRQVITITDIYGNAGTYQIQAVPAFGTILGNDTVYTDEGSVTLYDSETLMAWVSQ